MAERQFRPLPLTNVPKLVILAFAFLPQGTSAPKLSAECASYVKVVWTSTGTWTITLTDAYAALVSGQVTIQMASATDVVPQWGAIDVVTAKTLVLRANATATPTDIAANAGNIVYVTLFLRNSTVAV
jgi:hypothetical protein